MFNRQYPPPRGQPSAQKEDFPKQSRFDRAAFAFLDQLTAPPSQRSEEFKQMIEKMRNEAA